MERERRRENKNTCEYERESCFKSCQKVVVQISFLNPKTTIHHVDLDEVKKIQEKTEKVKMIQEKMRVSQSRQKSYHDKWRKNIEFQVGDHVFLRVSHVTGVRRALKGRKLTPHSVGPFDIVEKVGVVAYRIALPPSLANLHNVFHVSQLRKYVYDASHMIQVDDLDVRDNLTVET